MLEFLPASAEELVVALDKEFPPRCIEENQSERSAHRYAGKREMINWLLDVMEDTRQEMLMNQS